MATDSSAGRVIERFGGQSALARLIGKNQSTVQYWASTGSIPHHWHGRLLTLARDQKINLTPADLVSVPEDDEIPVEVPRAKWSGVLQIGEGVEVPCYVLNNGLRVISRTGAAASLTGIKGQGNLESYLRIAVLRPYLPANFDHQMIEFALEGVTHKTVRGITAETFIEVCRAYVSALEDGALQTDRQKAIAAQAAVFLAACAKVGLLALIDEATGYQYYRAEDALRMKLKVFIEDEMRKWEKTFPDQLWVEFGRLTGWKGATHSQRPKYWGSLVMELVYGYLDPDVARWLKENAPKPMHGQNYHQWLTSQYGLKRLTEHIWMLIGVATACSTMAELRQRMAERFGKHQVQFTLFIDPPTEPRVLPAVTDNPIAA